MGINARTVLDLALVTKISNFSRKAVDSKVRSLTDTTLGWKTLLGAKPKGLQFEPGANRPQVGWLKLADLRAKALTGQRIRLCLA